MLSDQETEQHLITVSGLFALLADLICNTAGGFARGLAGSLALAAAARLEGLVKVAGAESFYSFHGDNSLMNYCLRFNIE